MPDCSQHDSVGVVPAISLFAELGRKCVCNSVPTADPGQFGRLIKSIFRYSFLLQIAIIVLETLGGSNYLFIIVVVVVHRMNNFLNRGGLSLILLKSIILIVSGVPYTTIPPPPPPL